MLRLHFREIANGNETFHHSRWELITGTRWWFRVLSRFHLSSIDPRRINGRRHDFQSVSIHIRRHSQFNDPILYIHEFSHLTVCYLYEKTLPFKMLKHLRKVITYSKIYEKKFGEPLLPTINIYIFNKISNFLYLFNYYLLCLLTTWFMQHKNCIDIKITWIKNLVTTSLCVCFF